VLRSMTRRWRSAERDATNAPYGPRPSVPELSEERV
jgi:hypothetical protein